MTASESARAFAALSESDREKAVSETCSMLRDKCRGSYLRSTIPKFALSLHETGHLDDFKALGEDFWSVWKLWNKHVDLDTGFALIGIEPNLEPGPFGVTRYLDFSYFDEFYMGFASIFRNNGSDSFKKAIHRYFVRYGSINDDDKNPQYDPYLTYAAVILMRKHGEETVIDMLDRITRETPLSAIDFIRLVQSDQDFSNIPLVWALEIVSKND